MKLVMMLGPHAVGKMTVGQKSEELFRKLESEHRLNTKDDEKPFKNYLKIDNTNLSLSEAVQKIKDAFA